MKLPVLALVALLASCASHDPLAIPQPASSVTRAEVISTAYAYTRMEWMPEDRHVRHGGYGNGITVHTPDVSLNRRKFAIPLRHAPILSG